MMKHWIRFFCLSLLTIVTGIASAQDVIEISTVEQLKEFRDNVNSGTTYKGKTVKLTADLDLQGEDWFPIGYNTMASYPGTAFKGDFDGCNNTISNVKVNSSEPNYATAGFFGSIEEGSIKNLTLKNVNITSTHYAAGIVAYTSNGPTIENCHVIGGTIKSTPEIVNGSYNNGDKVGGIMGYATSGSTINNCTVEGVTISGYRDLGGIVGYSDGTVTKNTAKNVTVTQDLTNGYKDTPPTTIGDIVGRGSATNNVEANGNKVIKSDPVAQIGVTKYETLAEAVAAATAGDVIEIIKAGDYTLPAISKNVTIEGKADGVVSFTHTTAGSVASIPNGATFKNVTFNFGNVNYHGFQHAGTINMEGCTLNGLLFSYSDMNFTNCTFGQSNKDYHMWCYAGNVTYNSCTFTNSATGKFLNIYNEDGATKYTVTVNNCKFVNNAAAAKAALNVKATCGSKLLAYDVIINECTTEGAFPEASSSQTLVVLNNLVQVDDRTADGVDNITVTQDGKIIYPVNYVAQIGEGESAVKYETLAEAVAAADTETTTITLLKDVKEGIVVKDGKNIVLDLNGKTMTGGIDQYDANIVVKNGTVAGTVYVNGAAENTENYNKFTLDATATIIAKDYGIILWQSDKNTAYGSTIDINGTINGCVFVMGNIKEGNSVINVNDGATIKGEVGIALNGYATLNVVDGATIEGTVDSGIEVRAGKLNVTGGKISSTASEYAVNPNGSGTTTTGAAIAVAQHTTKLATDVVISGGELSGVKTISVADPQNNNLEGVTVKVADVLANAETVVIPEGYKWVSADGMSTLTKKEYVAQIGETQYETLADAVAAATADATTITLLKDVKEGIVVKDGKNIVLDLNGKTMTGGIDQYDADIVVKNGTVAGTVYVNGAAENTENYNKFTLDATATIIAKDYGIILWQSDKNTAYGSTIDINGTINGCVFVMGNIKEGNSVINVNDGATIKGEVGIALNGYATLNVVDGATIEGTVDSGIEVRAGKLSVTGGKISSTASEYAVNPNGSGTTTTGAAIAVAQHTTKLATDVVISGGELSGVKTISVADPQNNNLEGVTVKVADALANVGTVVIPEGYKWVSADGMSTLTKKEYVAQIGEGENIVKYETLAEAVAAATADATTITLLKDVKEGIVVKDGKNIVLDLNGKTMTGGIDQYDADIVVKNGTVAGTVYVNGAAENTENYNKFTLDATATIIAKDYGIILWQSDKNTAYGSTIDINGTINGCVFVMGNIKEGNSVINVNDGATIKGEVGIALNGYATLNVVDGATIEGTVDSGIEVRAGKLNVEGGKISSTASKYTVNPNGSGTTTTGAAIAVAQHTTKLATDVVISGGELSGVKTISVADPQNNNLEGVTVKVADALANAETVVIPEGYKWVSADGMSTLTKKEYVAQVGDVKYETLKEALDAAKDNENIVVELLADATLDLAAWSGVNNKMSIGSTNTKSITINGNNHQLTFNQTNSDWNNVATMNDAETKLILNDMAITNSGHNEGTTWNKHDINFNCAVELNNVTSDKALAFKNDATIKNVTITETAAVYGIWIQPHGQNVSIDGLTLTAQRGIKIDEQYVNDPEKVTLDIANATFNTTKKAGVLVKSKGGADISVGEGINIENVAADKENLVWVDEASAEEFYKVAVAGATVVPESKESDYVACLMKGEQRWGFYKELSKAINKVEDGYSIKLHQTTTEAVEVSKPLTITKNGFTADNVTAGEGYMRLETEKEIVICEYSDPVLKDWDEEYAYPKGMAVNKVTYLRTFKEGQVGKYQAWYVPFDYTITADDVNDFKFYRISMIAAAAEAGVVDNVESIYIYLQPVGEGTVLKANRPYVVVPNKAVTEHEFVAENIEKLYPIDPSSRLNEKTTHFYYDFYGNYKQHVYGANEIYAMNGGNIALSTGGNRLGTYRWYIKTTAISDDYAKPNIMVVGDGEDVDGINNGQVSCVEIQGIYTLGGVKVEHPVKGVNIIKYTDGRTKKINVK